MEFLFATVVGCWLAWLVWKVAWVVFLFARGLMLVAGDMLEALLVFTDKTRQVDGRLITSSWEQSALAVGRTKGGK